MLEIEDRGETVFVNGKTLPIYNSNGYRYFLDAIPVEDLARDEETQPREYNEKAAKKIATSIKGKVIMQPILARYAKEDKNTTGEKKYVLIVEGQHRWRAEKDILGNPYIPAMVYLDMDLNIAQQCGLEANETDRARGLSGGAFAKKSFELFESPELRQDVADVHGISVNEITEEQILEKLGKYTKAQQKKFLLGWISWRLLTDEDSRLVQGKYVSDAQNVKHPITVKNLQFFLGRIVRTKPVDVPISDSSYLRYEEHTILRKATDFFTDIVLAQNWQSNDTSRHNHAKNVCRRHPFEAAGYFMGKILEKHGGRDTMLGAAYTQESDINWGKVEKDMDNLFNSSRWDEAEVYMCRSIEELIDMISQTVAVVR